MTRIVYHVAASEDGYIAGPGGTLDWLQRYESADEDYGWGAFIAGIDALVMGHATYDATRAFPGPWPYDDRPVWVLSRTASTPADAPAAVRFTKEGPRTLAARWKTLGRQRCWLVGGGRTARAFAEAGLIDELVLTRVPVQLGSGIALFGGDQTAPPTEFEADGRTPLARGLVQERYVRR